MSLIRISRIAGNFITGKKPLTIKKIRR